MNSYIMSLCLIVIFFICLDIMLIFRKKRNGEFKRVFILLFSALAWCSLYWGVLYKIVKHYVPACSFKLYFNTLSGGITLVPLMGVLLYFNYFLKKR